MSKTLLSAPLAALEQGDDFIRRHLGPCSSELPGMLAAVGASLDDVMHVHVYLKDCADFAEMNRAYAEVFGAHRPARTVIGVADLPKPGARMTMDLMAYCPQAGREGEREGLPPDWL